MTDMAAEADFLYSDRYGRHGVNNYVKKMRQERIIRYDCASAKRIENNQCEAAEYVNLVDKNQNTEITILAWDKNIFLWNLSTNECQERMVKIPPDQTNEGGEYLCTNGTGGNAWIHRLVACHQTW